MPPCRRGARAGERNRADTAARAGALLGRQSLRPAPLTSLLSLGLVRARAAKPRRIPARSFVQQVRIDLRAKLPRRRAPPAPDLSCHPRLTTSTNRHNLPRTTSLSLAVFRPANKNVRPAWDPEQNPRTSQQVFRLYRPFHYLSNSGTSDSALPHVDPENAGFFPHARTEKTKLPANAAWWRDGTSSRCVASPPR